VAAEPESGLLAGQTDPAMREVLTGISRDLRARYGPAVQRAVTQQARAPVPVTDLDADLLRLKMIVTAKERGLTWAQIGSSFGMSGREAKRHAHHLARSCQRRVVTRDAAAAAS
jgi:hypothetical protein